MAGDLTMVFPAISIFDPYCHLLHRLTMEALQVIKLPDKAVTGLESFTSRPMKFDRRYEARRLRRTKDSRLLVVRCGVANWMNALSGY